MKNEHGLTQQQEVFAVALADGKSQDDAMRLAHPRTSCRSVAVNDDRAKAA